MSVITRKKILGAIAHAIVILLLTPGSFSAASDRFKVDHPLMPPSPQFSGQIPKKQVPGPWERRENLSFLLYSVHVHLLE